MGCATIDFTDCGDFERTSFVEGKRRGKHTIDRFNRSGFAAFTTIDGMPTVPASLRIGLGAKWKNSEGARQIPLPNGMTLACT